MTHDESYKWEKNGACFWRVSLKAFAVLQLVVHSKIDGNSCVKMKRKKRERAWGRSFNLSYLRTPGKLLHDMGELVGLLVTVMLEGATSVPMLEKCIGLGLGGGGGAMEQFNCV